MALESGPQGAEQHANWKAPEKKPFNPALMEETQRDIKKESADMYKDLPPPPVAEDDVPTYLGNEVQAPRVERTDFDMGDLDIDSFLSNIKESANEPATRDMLADTLPGVRGERASDYDLSPPPVETQAPENLEMRGEKIVIDGTEYDVPPVLDEAAQAVMDNPELLDLKTVVANPDQMAKFLPGLDKYGRDQVIGIFKVRDLLMDAQMRTATTPEQKAEITRRSNNNLVETIKEEQVRTAERKSQRKAA